MIVQSDVLLIEDNESDLELTNLAFRKGNIRHSMETVSNSQEALDYLSSTGRYTDKKPDDLPKLILLDILMPHVDGWKILYYLKSHNHTAHIPVVIVSDLTYEEAAKQGQLQDTNGYLLKPILLNIFIQELQKITTQWLSLIPVPTC